MTGRVLDPDLRAFVDELNARAGSATPSIEERRAGAVVMLPEFRGMGDEGYSAAAITAEDRRFPSGGGDVATRVYLPEAALRGRPTVAFIHGGGFTTGSLETYDVDCRVLAERLDATVVSIDYRLAPEHPYPAGLQDCLTVVRALRAEVTGALGVAGDSAGANLALAVSLALRGAAPALDAQLLLYPAIDPEVTDNGSYRENGAGYLLTTGDMRYYYDAYLEGGRHAHDELGAPSRATTFAGVQPTVLASAGFDPLRDESRDLARRFVSDDVEVHYLPNPSLTHGFQQLVPRIPAAGAALDRAYTAFRLLLERAG
jgi:acetyl esterase